MTEIAVYQCDGCGHEVRDARPETWRHVEDEALVGGLDFCESCARDLDRLEEEG